MMARRRRRCCCWVGLLALALLLGWASADGLPLPRDGCELRRLSLLRESDGARRFLLTRGAHDRGSFCEAVEAMLADGCGDLGAEFGEISDKYCFRDRAGSVAGGSHQMGGRKMLVELGANKTAPANSTNDGQRRDGQENPQHGSSMLSPGKVAIAIPGAFLLCCAFLCPCFQARAREEQPVLKEMRNGDSSSSYDPSSHLGRFMGSPLRVPGSPPRVPGSPLRVPPSPSRFSLSPRLSRVGSVHLDMSQVLKATQNFGKSHVIGEGGFGTVYKAELPGGQNVAIKRARREHFASLRAEFSSEVELLSKIEHRNLVRLLGYIDNGNERIIITEYVSNGTLREHLDGRNGRYLDFSQRLEIAIDVAHALTYLHLYAEKPVIHRDVKSTNILLTDKLRAKVADFGFARTGPTDEDQTHVSTRVRGTAGYVDPEYLKTYKLTTKSDVFSFGVLLLEIITGRRPVEMRREVDERITIRWAFKKYTQGRMREILDPNMQEVVHGEVLSKIIGLAFDCAAPTRNDRPTMKQVQEKLWEIRKEYGRSRE